MIKQIRREICTFICIKSSFHLSRSYAVIPILRSHSPIQMAFVRKTELKIELRLLHVSINTSLFSKHPDLVIDNKNRVKLDAQCSKDGSDYINASYIMDSYPNPKLPLYIATQCPMDNTVDDFWQVVCMYDLSCYDHLKMPVADGVGEGDICHCQSDIS